MSQNKNFSAGFLALALLAVLPFQSNLVRADDSSAPSAEDGYELKHLQPGTEISVSLHGEVPSGESMPLGVVPGATNDFEGSCKFVPSASNQNREIDGTFFITVTSTGCGMEGEKGDCTLDYVDFGGINMYGVSTFNGIPQSASIALYCESDRITIAQFKALIEKNGGTFKSPGPIKAQQL